MVLAGIDEAGYGPLLGPLVVGCCAFEVQSDSVETASDDVPCLWKRLRRVVSRKRDRSGRRIHVNDSKLVYSPAQGMRELERAVLSLAMTVHQDVRSLDELLQGVAPHCVQSLEQHGWYSHASDERFPIDCDAVSVRLLANALRVEMGATGTVCVHLQARVLPERQLNDLMRRTRNKGSALFSTAAIHMDELIHRFADRDLVIFCDRQGGREHYGPLLRQMFEDWSLEVSSESPQRAEYALTQRHQRVRIVFAEKAESQCLSVAAASMLSKYLREALMHRFNAFWRRHLPDVEPTAGYYTDGVRFLQDIQLKRTELGVTDDQLVRWR